MIYVLHYRPSSYVGIPKIPSTSPTITGVPGYCDLKAWSWPTRDCLRHVAVQLDATSVAQQPETQKLKQERLLYHLDS
mgnify:CR=1 FL=1